MLNPQQQIAVDTTEGPLLIIAGAGSGKTRVLTLRIAKLIENGVSPWNILAVTFTNKAANEMKERIRKILNLEEDASLKVNMGTFHSICTRILREEAHLLGYENKFTIYDTADSVALMKNIMEDLQIDPKKLNPKAILGQISNAKNHLINEHQYEIKAANEFQLRVGQLYKEYQKRLAQAQAFDFDDLIMKPVEIFEKNPDILSKYQERFKYILVDEYQDTNHAQYVLTNMLAKKYKNLCVVGDSDQSIYSFRGANIQNILDFEKDYKNCTIIKLEQNYRSTQNILKAAHNIITKNKARKEKEMWTENDEGQKIKVLKAMDERHEGELIAAEIRKLLSSYESPKYNDFVVLYRTNAQSRILEETMLRNAIPYKIVGGVKFYERKEIKDLISYLKVIHNPNNSVSLLRIINTPARKIGPQTLLELQNKAFFENTALFEAMKNPNCLSLPKQEQVLKFVNLIKELQVENLNFPASGVLKQIIHRTGYKDYILSEDTKEAASRYENILEFISVAEKYDFLEPGISLATFLEEVALVSDLDTFENENNAVTLMTLHSAKGLEFDTVFIAGTEEGILPHTNSLFDQQELEEERRLMYVGITRAKQNLYLLHASERMLYGNRSSNPQSQFIADINENLLVFNYQKKTYTNHISPSTFGSKPIPHEDTCEPKLDLKNGDIIEHKIFGIGKILNLTGDIGTVIFEDQSIGTKKLAMNVAPIKKI